MNFFIVWLNMQKADYVPVKTPRYCVSVANCFKIKSDLVSRFSSIFT